MACHEAAFQINRALVEDMDVIGDFRPPNGIRLGLSPLYISFAEVWQAVDRLRRIVEEELYTKYPLGQQALT